MKNVNSFFLIITFSSVFGIESELGKLAPEFSLHDQDGSIHRLTDYRGKRLVIYFFPKADTPGWTKQACGFRDESKKFSERNIAILGISYDSQKELKRFKNKYKIPFPLLSDEKKVVGVKYGVDRVFFTARKTFLINEKGLLIHIINEVNLNSHPRDILSIFELVKSLNP